MCWLGRSWGRILPTYGKAFFPYPVHFEWTSITGIIPGQMLSTSQHFRLETLSVQQPSWTEQLRLRYRVKDRELPKHFEISIHVAKIDSKGAGISAPPTHSQEQHQLNTCQPIRVPIAYFCSQWNAHSVRPDWVARSHLSMLPTFATCVEILRSRCAILRAKVVRVYSTEY